MGGAVCTERSIGVFEEVAMSIGNYTTALRILAASMAGLFLSPLLVLAQEEPEHTCIRDQYVISTTIPALGEKAAEALDAVDPAPCLLRALIRMRTIRFQKRHAMPAIDYGPPDGSS